MSKIRVHKQINSLPVDMGKEAMHNTFYGLMRLYNKQKEYKDLVISKQDLWELTGYKGKYKAEYMGDLIRGLTKGTSYQANKKIVSGSIFVTTLLPSGEIQIEVPRSFQEFIFYKTDIDLMTKAKKKEQLTVKELDYWDRVGKNKSKFLVLLEQADILHIKGKYNKRLYALLMQWAYIGVYDVAFSDFKEILEIPKSYQACNIEQRVLEVAKKELLKVGIEIKKIVKKKTGRSITGIKIIFTVAKKENQKETKKVKEKLIQEPIKYRNGAETPVRPVEPFHKTLEYTEQEIERAILKAYELDGFKESFFLKMRNKSESLFLNTIKEYMEPKEV